MSLNWLTVVEKWLVIGQFCNWLFFFSTVSGFLRFKFCFCFLSFFRDLGIVSISKS